MRTRSRTVYRIAQLVIGAALAMWSGACSAAVDSVAIADAQTAVRVKTVLINDADLGPHAIEVTVTRGQVTLSGRVASPEQAERAVQLSRGVEGVTGVSSALQIGGTATPAPEDRFRDDPSAAALVPSEEEPQRAPLLLAVGAAVGWSDPRAGALLSQFALSPIIKLGWGEGFGPTVSFGWFRMDVHSAAAQPDILSRVHVKPIMAGIAYTVANDRVSISPSIVGGVAFNSVTITDTGTAAGLPVEVDNSLAWRPGISVWFDAGRIAFNVSTGFLITDLRITILEGGRLVKRDARGDTALVHVGVAYRLF